MSAVVPPVGGDPIDPWLDALGSPGPELARDPTDPAVKAEIIKEVRARSERSRRAAKTREGRRPITYAPPDPNMPSEDALALEFLDHYKDHLYVSPMHRWMVWDGKRWKEDATGRVYDRIRKLVRSAVEGGKAERGTANASFVSGVERLLHHDQRITVMPDSFDRDQWALNTQSGIVDLRSGVITPHDPDSMCSHITNAEVNPDEGRELWLQFLDGITQGNEGLASYLQRVAGYCATGAISEDVLVFLFGIGSNGKSSFAEAIAHALGDYSRQFAPEVLMENHGVPGHPTELAQFRGVRFALTSEPASNSSWNDSRIKFLTGDEIINARVMRGDPFEFKRTHKTMVLGNHMPKLNEVTSAIKRRVQMVPFRATFTPKPGEEVRERLKAECGGAILTWIIRGAQLWAKAGTAPVPCVVEQTNDYLSEQDIVGQWVAACCARSPDAMFERINELHKNYSNWCEREGYKPKSAPKFTEALSAAGFRKHSSSIGKVFHGVKLKVE